MLTINISPEMIPTWYKYMPVEILRIILAMVPKNNLLFTSKEAYNHCFSLVQSLKFSPTTSRYGYLPRNLQPSSALDELFYNVHDRINSLDLSAVKEEPVIAKCLQYFTNLTYLNLENTLELHKLPIDPQSINSLSFLDFLSIQTTLTTLNINGIYQCPFRQRHYNIINNNLFSLDEEIKSRIENITYLTNLTDLDISFNPRLVTYCFKFSNLSTLSINGLSIRDNIILPPNLSSLEARDTTFKILDYLSTLTNLTSLDISNSKLRMGKYYSIQFLPSLTNLTSLNLARREIKEDPLPYLSTLTKLNTVDLSEIKIKKITTITELTLPSTLTALHIDFSQESFTDKIPSTSHLTNINTLSITNCKFNIDAPSLINITSLCFDSVIFEYNNPFLYWTNIENLTMIKCFNTSKILPSISSLSYLKHLKLCLLVDLNNGLNIKDFISNTTLLTSLKLEGLNYTTINIENFLHLTNLTSLTLFLTAGNNTNLIDNIQFFSFLTNLKKLVISEAIDINYIPANVTRLTCYGQIDNFSLITNLTNLNSLQIHYNNFHITNMFPLTVLCNIGISHIDINRIKAYSINTKDLESLNTFWLNNKSDSLPNYLVNNFLALYKEFLNNVPNF